MYPLHSDPTTPNSCCPVTVGFEPPLIPTLTVALIRSATIDLPQGDGLFWVFSSDLTEGEVRKWGARIAILCHFVVGDESVYVLGRARDALPENMRDCDR
jgi:hypothetical protein